MKSLKLTLMAVMCGAALSAPLAFAGETAMAHEGAMHPMMDKPMTGDADKDFALHMRHHHLMGVEMAKKELAAGDDAAMRTLAEGIIAAQTAEVAKLDGWLARMGVDVDDYPMMAMPSGMHRFEDMDGNGDGFLDHSELGDTHPMHAQFATADTNADGKLDRAEVEAHHAAMHDDSMPAMTTGAPHPEVPGVESFASLDKNGDGLLVHQELPDAHMLHQHFAVADTNKDGKLSPAEVDAHHTAMHASMKH